MSWSRRKIAKSRPHQPRARTVMGNARFNDCRPSCLDVCQLPLHPFMALRQFSRSPATIFAAMLFVLQAPAAVLYVDVNSPGPAPPYNSIATAATDIQTAVDAANNGDLILVNDGFYATGSRATKQSLIGLPSSFYDTNRLVIGKPVIVQSIDGPNAAYIDGGGQFRCAFVTNGAALSGFTLQNGRAGWLATTVLLGHSTTKTNAGYGAGVAGVSPGFNQGLVTNCIISGNFAYGYGGGASEVSLINCTLGYNSAISGGGTYACSLTNCVVNGNNAETSVTLPKGPQPPTTTDRTASLPVLRRKLGDNQAFQRGDVAWASSLLSCRIYRV